MTTPRAALAAALDTVAAAIDDPARYIEVNRLYRDGWTDALRAVRDELAALASQGYAVTRSEAGLDVERLAPLLHAEWDRRTGEPSEPDVPCEDCLDSARHIAAEYLAADPEPSDG